ncbi:MAG: NADPH-dependent assimilatory sulfite reductase hemoprotein subunit [Caldilineaceae bacterium]|nr:NADPH-dependent assimilatory sulfite reductase hemoprotein subunit [Caldilineaceae bacterium]
MSKQSVENIKLESKGLYGPLPDELRNEADHFTEAGKQLLKFHGIYQQHDRDVRGRNNRQHTFMVRSRIPGGRLNVDQYLVHDALADEYGQGDFRLTTRQSIQIHGVIKGDLPSTLRGLNNVLISTLSACGDVTRNVMCCPAPLGDGVRSQIEEQARGIAMHLAPRTKSYHEIWLENDEGVKVRQHFDDGAEAVEEPIYGKTYLPRKFKIALAAPGDNCTDILTNDIGIVGLADDAGVVHGYNVFVGGGMGMTHGKEDTYPRLATPLAYAPAEKLIDVVEKIVLVQRDHGDRTDRRHARMKYVVQEWGIERFRQTVEQYLGYTLDPVQEMPALEHDDHLGWQQQADGRWFLGIYVENGRVRDEGDHLLRTGLRHIIGKFGPGIHITGQQNLLLSGFTTEQKDEINTLLAHYKIARIEELTNVRRNAMACPAMPTCGLAISEAERYLPDLITELEAEIADLGLGNEIFAVRMTGCPNGCARPYVADIGLVGQSLDKYAIYLGGNLEGTRLNILYRELIHKDNLRGVLRDVLLAFRERRQPGERFGDWAIREDVGQIERLTLELAAA